MAVKQNNSGVQRRQPVAAQRKPDGYLNVAVIDRHGNQRRINKGIPLYAGSELADALLNAADADPDKVFNLVGSVHVTEAEPEVIEL